MLDSFSHMLCKYSGSSRIKSSNILYSLITMRSLLLRMARVLLYHQCEQKIVDLRHNTHLPTLLSSGNGLASIAKSFILEKIYGSQYKNLTPQASKKRKNSLKWHIRIGKRWSYIISQLGTGIIMTCSQVLEIHM